MTHFISSFFSSSKNKQTSPQSADSQLEDANKEWGVINQEAQETFRNLEERLRKGRNGKGRFMVTVRRNLFMKTTEKVREFIIQAARELMHRIKSLESKLSEKLPTLVEAKRQINSLFNCLELNTLQCYDKDLSKLINALVKFFEDHRTLQLDDYREGGRSRRRHQSRGRKEQSRRGVKRNKTYRKKT